MQQHILYVSHPDIESNDSHPMHSVLAGEGVRQWARQQGIPDCHPDDLITGGCGLSPGDRMGNCHRTVYTILSNWLVYVDRARQVYLDHKARLDGVTQLAGKRRRVEEEGRVVSGFLSAQVLVYQDCSLVYTAVLYFRTYRSV